MRNSMLAWTGCVRIIHENIIEISSMQVTYGDRFGNAIRWVAFGTTAIMAIIMPIWVNPEMTLMMEVLLYISTWSAATGSALVLIHSRHRHGPAVCGECNYVLDKTDCARAMRGVNTCPECGTHYDDQCAVTYSRWLSRQSAGMVWWMITIAWISSSAIWWWRWIS